MKKENLSKLTLRKETLAKLNSVEMKKVQGGSTWLCAAEAAVTLFVAGHEESLWACNLTHGADEIAPMNTLEQGCNTFYNG